MIAHFADLFIFQQLPVVKREPHPNKLSSFVFNTQYSQKY